MKTSCVLAALIACSIVGQAQNNSVKPPQVIPISPNASALAQYADYPVSYYTGIPNISIPLYEIEIDGYKLPLSVSYHAGGIKVSQEASWVGLGWALNAGGTISRTIKCFDDFLEYAHPTVEVRQGYYKDPDISNPYNSYYYTNVNTGEEGLSSHPRLTIDAEPDIFYYSLPGSSGKFIIDKQRGAVLFDKSSNVKIDIIFDNSISSTWTKNLCFNITTPDGTQYYYKNRETTRVYADGGSLNENSTSENRRMDDNESAYTNQPEISTSSWYLDKITTPAKRVLSFIYVRESYKSPTMESCQKYTYVSSSGSIPCGPSTVYPNYSRNKTTQENLRLSQIRWDGGYVLFIASDRQDMIGIRTDLAPQKLDEINVYDNSNILRKKIQFNYSYFDDTRSGQYQYLYKRLKLDNIVKDGEEGNKHVFKYFEGDIPAKNSNNIDFWGYNNGKIYGSNYYTSLYNGTTLYDGANKLSNPDYLKIGTLNEIVYPTGGSSVFTYEANDFTSSDLKISVPETTETTTLTVYNQYSTIGEHEGVPSYNSYTFTVTGSARFSITKYMENMVCPRTDPDFMYDNSSFLVARLRRVSPSAGVVWSCKMPLVNGRQDYCEYIEEEQGFFPQVLTAGTYVFEALTPPKDVFTRWKVKLLKGDLTEVDCKGGGLRIAQITAGDKVRTFKYPLGTLLIKPVLAYGQDFICYVAPATGTLSTIVQLSNSTIPLSTLRNGNAVGYDWVEEYVTQGGMTRYYFLNDPEEGFDDDYTYYYSPYLATQPNYFNGLTDHVEYYDNNSTLLRTTQYTYQSQYSDYIKAFYYNESANLIFQYAYKISWPFKRSEEMTTWSRQVEGTKSMGNTEVYTYNSNAQLSAQKTQVSDGWDEKQIFYPSDYTDGVSQEMAGKFMVGVPVETIGLKDDQVVAGQKTVYKNVSGMYLPGTIYSLTTQAPLPRATYSNYYTPEIVFDRYNQWGKIQQITKKGNVVVSYVWAYNGEFPIAEVVNASYDEVVAAIGGEGVVNQLNQSMPSDAFIRQKVAELRNHLPAAQVTGYTYKPLLGMSGKTDVNNRATYYDYDASGRLKTIRDQDQHIVKRLCYNYVGQPEPCRVFYNTAKSGTFNRSNCGTNYQGGAYTYVVPAGRYDGNSQSEADALAEADVTANGQQEADLHGTCTTVTWYYNTYQSQMFTRNNCSAGYAGENYWYEVPAATCSSYVSQAAADQLALDRIAQNGQEFANAHSSCLFIYKSVDASNYYTSRYCQWYEISQPIYVYMPAGSYTSTVSQQDANDQAVQAAQDYANQHATCYPAVEFRSTNNWYYPVTLVFRLRGTFDDYIFYIEPDPATTQQLGYLPAGVYDVEIYPDMPGNYMYYFSGAPTYGSPAYANGSITVNNVTENSSMFYFYIE